MIDFVSTSVEKLNDHEVRVSGQLTLLGVTKPIAVDVDVQREKFGRSPAPRVPRRNKDRPAGVRDELRLSPRLTRGGSENIERGGGDLSGEARPARWSVAQIALHWLAGALILELVAHGWIMVHANLTAATAFGLYQSHKSLGFVVLALTAARLAFRFSRKAPPQTHGAEWESALPTSSRRRSMR